MEVEKLYRSKKDYLPKELIEYTLELYENKTTLKDIMEEKHTITKEQNQISKEELTIQDIKDL